jgi:hypothetical protein
MRYTDRTIGTNRPNVSSAALALARNRLRDFEGTIFSLAFSLMREVLYYRVSNDNHYIEAACRTLKYAPELPATLITKANQCGAKIFIAHSDGTKPVQWAVACLVHSINLSYQ